MARDEVQYRQMPVTSNMWRRRDFDGIMRRRMPVYLSVVKSPGLAGGTVEGNKQISPYV